MWSYLWKHLSELSIAFLYEISRSHSLHRLFTFNVPTMISTCPRGTKKKKTQNKIHFFFSILRLLFLPLLLADAHRHRSSVFNLSFLSFYYGLSLWEVHETDETVFSPRSMFLTLPASADEEKKNVHENNKVILLFFRWIKTCFLVRWRFCRWRQGWFRRRFFHWLR